MCIFLFIKKKKWRCVVVMLGRKLCGLTVGVFLCWVLWRMERFMFAFFCLVLAVRWDASRLQAIADVSHWCDENASGFLGAREVLES